MHALNRQRDYIFHGLKLLMQEVKNRDKGPKNVLITIEPLGTPLRNTSQRIFWTLIVDLREQERFIASLWVLRVFTYLEFPRSKTEIHNSTYCHKINHEPTTLKTKSQKKITINGQQFFPTRVELSCVERSNATNNVMLFEQTRVTIRFRGNMS